MRSEDNTYFELLKKKIVATMQQSNPGINPSISEWKGQEIVDFQEDLLRKVNANISEKWFYTHIKSEHRSLPRIDVLNILSKYAGYANWDDFIYNNSEQTYIHTPLKKANRYFIIVPILVLVFLCAFYGLFKLFSTREYKFCFYDADTREPIANTIIEVSLLLEGESPLNSLCKPNECFVLKTGKSYVKMVVKAPYYKTDTISRFLNKFNRNEMVSLHANDYALIIHYFSSMKVEDWQNRRTRLDKIIDDRAMIYQVYNEKKAIGMELYNKWEFIDKLTIPSGSLKQIEILDTKYNGDKIMVLRFRINENL
ncbi:MAG: hypothetical protein NT175_10665 [Bacteroidetes bacterium]|nr:hypothetical protein [Bacteroidota bacterium]